MVVDEDESNRDVVAFVEIQKKKIKELGVNMVGKEPEELGTQGNSWDAKGEDATSTLNDICNLSMVKLQADMQAIQTDIVKRAVGEDVDVVYKAAVALAISDEFVLGDVLDTRFQNLG